MCLKSNSMISYLGLRLGSRFLKNEGCEQSRLNIFA